MGMFGNRYRNCSVNSSAQAPNPAVFKVIEEKKVGRYYVSEVSYPNCKNFEGTKILVTTFKPSSRRILDPHFDDNGTVVARFSPSLGFEKAVEFVLSVL